MGDPWRGRDGKGGDKKTRFSPITPRKQNREVGGVREGPRGCNERAQKETKKTRRDQEEKKKKSRKTTRREPEENRTITKRFVMGFFPGFGTNKAESRPLFPAQGGSPRRWPATQLARGIENETNGQTFIPFWS
jgi:hypothetical protein